MPEDPHPELLEKVRLGDVKAFADYLDRRRPELLAFIQKSIGPKLRSKVEVEDVYQEVAVSALSSFAAMDFKEQQPFGWLCQLVERRLVDLHRKHFATQKRGSGNEVSLAERKQMGDGESPELIELITNSLTTPSQAFSRNQREAMLMTAIESLPTEAQQAIRLRYLENLPSKEIADRLGKSDAAVRVLLSRTLNQLEKILGSLK